LEKKKNLLCICFIFTATAN